MTDNQHKTGFTLIETLVAMALIVTIISMVYGSYFAASRSADTYQEGMELSRQTRRVLEQMARQVRCAYVGKPTWSSDSYAAADSAEVVSAREDLIDYFRADPYDPGGEILSLVTTCRLFSQESPTDGLVEVIYRLDAAAGTLFLSQKRFVGAPENVTAEKRWRPILSGIVSIEMSFLDGERWLPEWGLRDRAVLPSAVRIEITCEDANLRQYRYGTVEHLCCSDSRITSLKTEVARLSDK
jgi:prepilin-type N-terminal cleavage/methylation domain-containing protein